MPGTKKIASKKGAKKLAVAPQVLPDGGDFPTDSDGVPSLLLDSDRSTSAAPAPKPKGWPMNQRRAKASESTSEDKGNFTARADPHECIDPAVDDPETWDCECFQDTD